MSSFYSRLTSAGSPARTVSSSSGTAPPYHATSQDEELEAAFAEPDDDDDRLHPAAESRDDLEAEGEEDRLMQGGSGLAPSGLESTTTAPVPGAYDFERDPFSNPSTNLSASRGSRLRSLRDRFLPSALYNRLANQDSSLHPDDSPSIVPSGGASHALPNVHIPLPPRGPPPAPVSGTATPQGRTVGGGIQNDGVFANLSAKPDGVRSGAHGDLEFVGGDDDGEGGGGRNKDEVLPSYDTAALDAAPPYWETTVTLPGGTYGVLGPDDVLVEGLPVGNLFGFAWNLLVSMSFQFVGFLLTYLLHTTHAAKNGSRAGLGITLIQYGLYLRTRSQELANMSPSDLMNSTSSSIIISPSGTIISGDDDDGEGGNVPWGLFGSPPGRHDWDGSLSVSRPGFNDSDVPPTLTGGPGGRQGMYDGVITAEQLHMSSVANEWLSYVLMIVGWFLVLGGMLNYWRAVRWARAVRGETAAGGTAA